MRHHDRPRRAGPEVERPIEEIVFEILELPFLDGTLDHTMELVDRQRRVEFVGRLHTEQAGDAVRHRRQEPDDRGEELDVHPMNRARIRAERSGVAIAMFFGTISPITMCTTTTSDSAKVNEIA